MEEEELIEDDQASKGDAGLDFAFELEPGELVEVGPPAPTAASAEGVVFVSRSGEVLLARRKPKKLGGVELLLRDRREFAPFGRGPSLVGNHAYFVRENRVEMRPIGGEAPITVLAKQAQTNSRVSALELAPGKVAVAYLSTPDQNGTMRAMLVYDGVTHTLTPEGAGASSVALMKHGDEFFAVSIDGRTGMTPLHVRRFRLGQSGLVLDPDRVVWVGASAQPTTEVVAASDGQRPWALIGIEKNSSRFGLVELILPPPNELDARPSWLLFENGIDVAPVATARLCGRLYVAFARPVTSVPHPQELAIAEVGTSRVAVLAEARTIVAVSLAPHPQGGLLSFVADRATWAIDLVCRR